ncbi:MAG: hydroxyacid dehydrogenase [Burkholderiaceae bacterium]
MPNKIVISEFMDQAAVQWLSQRFDVLYQPDLHERRAALIDLLADADALIVRNRTRVDADLLQRQTRLKAVGRLGVGLENIDLDVCSSLGIAVIPAIGANAAAVAEYVVCCAMQLLRPAYASSAEVAGGAWPRDRLAKGREIGGKVLGIVGLGSVGRITATLAQALGMSVIAYDPTLDPANPAWSTVRRLEELDDVFRVADVVSLHVPLTAATRNLVDARRLALMRPDGILINVARGGVVDESALAQALSGGRLAGAALDVYEQEPLPSASVLAGVPNLILTPHIAGVTAESNVRVSFFIAEHIADHINKT